MQNLTTTINLSPRELATVLAALRIWQRYFTADAILAGDLPNRRTDLRDNMLVSIATDSGKGVPLTNSEIDKLCERLNCGGGDDDDADESDDDNSQQPESLTTFELIAGFKELNI
jgi:hypothetical protein